ncbi:hypothetical protein E2C01_038139 [Portunus trituberculatus]|uniref:Uncharacterized protein n=1 Tax=Portunus trituberculatus TaxID=210409 RepID=A0A5B7FG08_PORTR|nr:hypothetical protein [Portunus trituberculatus]
MWTWKHVEDEKQPRSPALHASLHTFSVLCDPFADQLSGTGPVLTEDFCGFDPDVPRNDKSGLNYFQLFMSDESLNQTPLLRQFGWLAGWLESQVESLIAAKETHCCWNTASLPSQAKPNHNTSLLQHLEPSTTPRVAHNTWSHEEQLA